jgi:hypothetical protein
MWIASKSWWPRTLKKSASDNPVTHATPRPADILIVMLCRAIFFSPIHRSGRSAADR